MPLYSQPRLSHLLLKSDLKKLRKLQNINNTMCKRFLTSASQPKIENVQETPKKVSEEKQMDKGFKASKSFVMNLFLGKSVTDQLIPYPNYLSTDEKETIQMLLDPADKFFTEVNDAALNDSQELIADNTFQGLKDMGCFGLQVPTEYGGLGLNNTQYARLGEIVGSYDLGVSITMGAHQSIGYKGILIVGDEKQKKKYLPRLSTGELIAAFALTEPSSGSDAGSIKSKAVPSADGSHFILNGSKIWISNGGLAEIFTVFAQTPVKNEKTGAIRDKVTAFIVERSFGGVSNGPPEKKMGIKASNTAEVYFEDVKIPAENVLGGVGNGFKVAMQILNNGRFGMAAALSGVIRNSLQKAVEFASNRTQFGNKISTYGVIQEKIARIAMYHYVTESLAFMISGNMDNKSTDYHLEAAISKVFASEAAWHSTDEAIQILGGMGYMRDSGLERVMRDLRIFRIFEGTNDILRLFVALTGLQNAGGHLKELQKAMKNPAVNFGVIFEEGTKRAKRAIGLSQSSVIEGVHPSLANSAALLSKSVDAFGTVSENLLIKHGKKIIDQQFVLNRVANSAIDIYTSAVVLSRATKTLNENLPSAQHERKMTNVWVNEAVDRINQNLLATSASVASSNFDDMASISKEVCENGGVVVSRPLGI